jgi:hypothetical protein
VPMPVQAAPQYQYQIREVRNKQFLYQTNMYGSL